MKKVLKVKIKRDQSGGATHYEYPPQYNPKKFQVITYETQLTDKMDVVIGRGNKDEYVLGFVEDVDVAGFLASPDIVEVNRAEADEFIGPDLDKATEKITDQNAVLIALAKVAKKEELSDEDKEVIDSSNKKPGINRSKSLREVLDENNI